ncbi:acylphosphatase [Bacteroidota bacterium]
MRKKQARFKISGLVQGVGFRYFVYSRAKEYGLKGYAKNLYDGTVETVVEGNEKAIEEFHKVLKTGPSRSQVDYVEVENNEYTGNYSEFDIK